MGDWSGAAQGAAGGAALGTSILPGYGTAVGGLLGGLAGYFGGGDSQQNKDALEEYRRQVLARGAPQIGGASQATTSDFRTNQQALIDRLDALSRGQGPSLAQAQLNEATDKNMAAQQSIAASGRGNPALASLTAANNMQNLGQNAAQQAVGARIAEQQMALGQLGQNISSGRQMDEATSQFNAQQQNYVQEANLSAKLKSMGLQDDAILNILQQYRQASAMPTMGQQLLAGGGGALGMYLGQKYGSNRGQSGSDSPAAYQSLAQQFPRPYGGVTDGPVTMPA